MARDLSITVLLPIRDASWCRMTSSREPLDLVFRQMLSTGNEMVSAELAASEADAQKYIVSELDLSHALQRRQFALHYQPQVDLATGRIIGTEALLRWHKPDAGLIYPQTFLRVAERSVLIANIGEWVLREACMQGAAWQPLVAEGLRISVNVSPFQFIRQDMESLIAESLRSSGLDPNFLDLEITESGLLDNSEQTSAMLYRLKSLGVQLSIDDFGIGYASLNYVKNYPVDRLKVDRSFVSSLPEGKRDAAIVLALTTLAHSLDIPIAVEGIETAQQLSSLIGLGCDEGQGFYFSQPLQADSFEALLRRSPAFTMIEPVKRTGVA